MASTYSSLLRIELIGTGDQSGTWGDTTNNNLGTLIEQAIAATATFSVTAGNVTLTDLNGSSDQARCAALLVTGSAGVSRNVIAPASSKLYVVSNTADAAIVLKTSTSTGLTIPSGITIFAFYNGTDFIAVSQPYDADLKAIADLATTGLIARTGSGTAATRTITASTGITVTNGDGVAGNPTIAVSTVPVANGGTNITSYTTGDIIYASGATTLSKLADVATGNALISGGVGVAPSWGKIDLTTHVSGILPVANGGTGSTTSTGTGSVVLSISPSLVTPLLGTPTSGTLTNCTGLPISTGVSGMAAGAATFLTTPSSANLAALLTDETGTGANVFATSPTLVTPLLGTPTSGTLTNCTGLPISTGVSGMALGAATFLTTPSSANLAALLTDETGTGANVFATSPTLVTPLLGTPTSGTLTNCTGLPVSTGISGLGTGVATALAVNVGSAGAAVVNGGALGTPSSGTLTSCTGLSLTTGVTGTLPVANGGTGVATLTGLAYGNGTAAFTAATAAQIVAAIGTTAVANATAATSATSATTATTATTATNATNAANLVTSNFSIVESGGKLLIKYGATTIASISSTGVITSSSDITGGGTP